MLFLSLKKIRYTICFRIYSHFFQNAIKNPKNIKKKLAIVHSANVTRKISGILMKFVAENFHWVLIFNVPKANFTSPHLPHSLYLYLPLFLYSSCSLYLYLFLSISSTHEMFSDGTKTIDKYTKSGIFYLLIKDIVL